MQFLNCNHINWGRLLKPGIFSITMGTVWVLPSHHVLCGQTAPLITQHTNRGRQMLVRAWIKETLKLQLKPKYQLWQDAFLFLKSHSYSWKLNGFEKFNHQHQIPSHSFQSGWENKWGVPAVGRRGWRRGKQGEPSSLSMSQTEAFASGVQAFKAQLITSLMNVKATDFTVLRKTDVKQILCLAVERHILQSGPYTLGSFVVSWHLDKGDVCVCVSKAQKSVGMYLKIWVHCDLVIL